MSASIAAPSDSASATRAASAEIAVDIAAGTSTHQHPQPALYRDTLHHLFSFLTPQEISHAARTQKRWLAAACSMKPRRDELLVKNTPAFDSLLRSPLRQHIGSLHMSAPSLRTPHRFLRLRHCMPHLTALSYMLQLSTDHLPYEALWPPLLTRLDVGLDGMEPPEDEYTEWDEEAAREAAERDRVIVGIGRSIATLDRLESLTVRPSFRTMPEDFLKPLLALSHLTELHLHCRVDEDSMGCLRCLPQLRKLVFENFLTPHVRALVDGDHAPVPPLASLPDTLVISLDTVDSVLRLASTLTELDCLCEPVVAHQLVQLTNVSKLALHFRRMFTSVTTPTAAIDGLRQMTQLTHLHLRQAHYFSSDHLATFLPELRALRSLQVWINRSEASLAFLSHAPASLTHLRLYGDQYTPVSDADHLHRLPQLHHLELDGLVMDETSSRALGQILLQSDEWDRKVWPNLRTCRWT